MNARGISPVVAATLRSLCASLRYAGILGASFLLSGIPLVTAQGVSATAPARNSAQWRVDLDKRWPALAPGQGAHTFSAALVPEAAARGETAVAATDGYNIDAGDTNGPTITPVVPDTATLDPADPHVVFEIDDGAGGSGFGEVALLEAVTLEVLPKGTAKTWRISLQQRDGRDILELILRLDPTRVQLSGPVSFQIAVTARDNIGNEGSYTGGFTLAPEPAEPFSISARTLSPAVITCSYKLPVAFDIDVAPRRLGGRLVPDRTLMVGGPARTGVVKLAAIPTLLRDKDRVQAAILDAMQVEVEGPAVAGPPSISEPSIRHLALESRASSSSIGTAVWVVRIPREVTVTYEVGRDFGGKQLSQCPDIDPHYQYDTNSGKLEPTRPFTPEALYVTVKGKLVDIQPGGAASARRLTLNVVNPAALPSGRFDYDAGARRVRFVIERGDDTPLSTGRSRATLTTPEGSTLVSPLRRDSDTYAFTFDDILEGRHRIESRIVSLGLFPSPATGGMTATAKLADDVVLKGPAPVIEALEYDYDSQVLAVKVSDDGTPVNRLEAGLQVDGAPYALELGADGRASILIPQTPFTAAVTLSVIDLAGQSASESLAIDGLPVFSQGTVLQPRSASTSVAPLPEGLSDMGVVANGRRTYRRTCPETCAPARMPEPSIDVPSQLRSQYPFTHLLQNCPWKLDATNYPFLDHKHYTWEDKKQRLLEAVAWEAARYELICTVWRKAAQGASAGADIGGAGRLVRSCSGPVVCGDMVNIDALPPEIEQFRLAPAAGQIAARIADHGGPLDELKIELAIDADFAHFTHANSQVSFDTISGTLLVSYPAIPVPERTSVTLRVIDAAGNSAAVSKVVAIPAGPPTIELTHYPIAAGNAGMGLLARISDPSGIDALLTALMIDGATCPSVQVTGSEQGPEGTWYCRVEVPEGAHVFAASAVDRLGLRNRAAESFTVSLPPRIDGLRLAGGHPDSPGASVFEATVTDAGGDMHAAGIAFTVDGVAVPSAQYVYDPASGYFAVDGPVALAPGFHRGVLSATDAAGNQSSARLNFNVGAGALAAQGDGELRLESVYLWELQGGNGDGVANPDELVRLFLTFSNQGSAALEGLRFQVGADDIGVKIERPVFTLAALPAGQTRTLAQGMDVRIAPDILSRDGPDVDRKDVALSFSASDARGNAWLLGAGLTMLEERASLAGATLPPATGAGANVQPAVALTQPGAGQVLNFGLVVPPVAVTVQGTFAEGDAPFTVLNLRIADAGSGAAAFDAQPGLAGPGLFSQAVALNAGTYTATATIQTDDGDQAVASATFTVDLLALLPASITITSPSAGQVVPGPPPPQFGYAGTFDAGGGINPFVFLDVNCDTGSLFEDSINVGAGTWDFDGSRFPGPANCQATAQLFVQPAAGQPSQMFTDTVNFVIPP